VYRCLEATTTDDLVASAFGGEATGFQPGLEREAADGGGHEFREQVGGAGE